MFYFREFQKVQHNLQLQKANQWFLEPGAEKWIEATGFEKSFDGDGNVLHLGSGNASSRVHDSQRSLNG